MFLRSLYWPLIIFLRLLVRFVTIIPFSSTFSDLFSLSSFILQKFENQHCDNPTDGIA